MDLSKAKTYLGLGNQKLKYIWDWYGKKWCYT